MYNTVIVIKRMCGSCFDWLVFIFIYISKLVGDAKDKSLKISCYSAFYINPSQFQDYDH